MTPWEVRCHKILRAMDETWLWNMKSSHLSTSPSLPLSFLLLDTTLFLCQGKGMSCKANYVVWLKTLENEQVTLESHWQMGIKPYHWNVSRMQHLNCVFMWQHRAATRPGMEENILSKCKLEMCKNWKYKSTACTIPMFPVRECGESF